MDMAVAKGSVVVPNRSQQAVSGGCREAPLPGPGWPHAPVRLVCPIGIW